MWLLLQAVLAAPCDMSALSPALTRAENAYLRGDAAALKGEARQARSAARCDDLSPEIVSRLHRVSALEHALANDWDGVVEALRSSVAAQPLAAPDPSLMADTRLAAAWYRAQEEPIVWTVKHPARVNGLETALRPDAPVWVGTGGSARGRNLRVAALGTGIIAGGLYAGAWIAHSKYEDVRGGSRGAVVPAHTATNALSVGSLGAAALSAGLLGASFAF